MAVADVAVVAAGGGEELKESSVLPGEVPPEAGELKEILRGGHWSVGIDIYIHTYTHIYIYKYKCIYLYIYKYMYTYIHIYT